MNSNNFQNHLKEVHNIDLKDVYNTVGVEYNEGYTLDTFEQEFSDAQSEKEKQDFFNKLLDSDVDFTIPENKERMVEYHTQLQDYRQELQIEEDNQINLELEMFPGKWQLYTCIKDINVCTSGKNYYVKIDDMSKQYQNDEIPEYGFDALAILAYISKMKPLIWIVTDDGIGTLKSKHLFTDMYSKDEAVYDRFYEHFTKYEK
jgi:hypothetical protein